MKNLILTLSIVGVMFANTNTAFADTIRLSEPVLKDATSETFGQPLNPALTSITLHNLMMTPSTYLGKPFQIETKITKVCQKKGCFFIAQQEEHILRVSFKDYGFFIPTDSGGKTVLMNGSLVQKELTQEQAAHFASDLKINPEAIKPGVVYEIVASSIKIPLLVSAG